MTEETVENVALAALAKKKVAAMEILKNLPKSGFNSYGNYNYVTDEDVMESMRDALHRAGIAFSYSVLEVNRFDNKVSVWLGVTFTDSETGAQEKEKWYGESLNKTQDKAPIIAITSAIKYGLLKTFLVSTGDAEADGDSDLAANKGQQAQPQRGDLATEKQRKAIYAMMTKLAGKTVDMTKALKAKGFPELSKLTKNQASELFKRLQEALDKKENPTEVVQEDVQEEPPAEDPF